MIMKSKSIFISAALAGVLLSSCVRENPVQPETVTAVSYNPVKGLIPNKTVTVMPQVESGTPADFAIQSVFYGETQWKGNMFSIDSKSGETTVSAPVDILPGDYYLSITCNVDGRKYIFSNALAVSIIPGMPDLNFNPAALDVRFEDLGTNSEAVLPFVSIVTENEAAPILGLEIRNVRKNGEALENGETLFVADYKQGTITPAKSDEWVIGDYVADVKVNTETYPSESATGLFADAVTFKVAAKPVVLSYPETPDFYQNQSAIYKAKFEDAVPTDLAVKSVTVNGETIDWNGLVSIDGNADICFAKVEDAKVGEYKVSVSYRYAGQELSSDNVLCVKCIAGMPEALVSDNQPSSIEIKTLDPSSQEELKSYTITPSGESAQILSYSIEKARKDGAEFDWNGKLILKDNVLSLIKGSWTEGEYAVDIRCVTTSFDASSPRGVFSEVVKFTVFEKVDLKYDPAVRKEHTGWTIVPSVPMPAGYVYSFKNAGAAYCKYLSIDTATGSISAAKGNALAQGNYEIEVVATSEGLEPSEAKLQLEIAENPYYFTYFYYGNNLGLTREEVNGASQYRVKNEAELLEMTIAVQESDINPKSGALYTLEVQHKTTKASVNEATGALSFEANATAGQQIGVVLVNCTTTDPEDALNTWSVTLPLAIDFSKDVTINVRFRPFFFRINPKTGGRTQAPELTGSVDDSVFDMDFRRNFYYYNINGKGSDGTPFVSGMQNVSGSFLSHIWDAFSAATGLNLKNNVANYGGKVPMSYYTGVKTNLKDESQLAKSPAYLVKGQWYVQVNPGLWQYDGGWADGVFFGEITYTNSSSTAVNSGTAINPVAIWLDPNFE